MQLDKRQINYRLKRYLWEPLEVRGILLQSSQKHHIANTIVNKLAKIDAREKLRSPYAMLVWLIKAERASILENYTQKEKKPARSRKNALGEELPLAGNVFHQIGGRYEGTASQSRKPYR